MSRHQVKSEPNPSSFIRAFQALPMSGPEIEAKSFEIIDREAPPHDFSPAQWVIVRRMIHTTGDFTIMEAVKFSPHGIDSAIEALSKGRPVYTDSNMVRAGISLARLRSVCQSYGPHSVICHIADRAVERKASESGWPRALFAVRKAKPILHGGIVVFGNSPVGLLEFNRLVVEEGIRPALVIAMPVGFVHVIEGKKELMSLEVPYIATAGRRGGSPLAVSVIHALCSLAVQGAEYLKG